MSDEESGENVKCAVCESPGTVIVAGFPFCGEHSPTIVVGGGQMFVKDEPYELPQRKGNE